MTRGKRLAAAIGDVKKIRGEDGLPVTGEHGQSGTRLRLHRLQGRLRDAHEGTVVRNSISPDDFYEVLLKDDLHDVRALLFPAWMPREIWLRTRHERVFRRLRVYDVAVSEIGFWNPDEYVNPHARYGRGPGREIPRPAHAFFFFRVSSARNRAIRSTRSYGTGLSSGN
jgi:hypothetical protein